MADIFARTERKFERFCKRKDNNLRFCGSITNRVGNRIPLPVIRLCYRLKSFHLCRSLQSFSLPIVLGFKYLKTKLKISYLPTKGKDFALREFSIATHTKRYRAKILFGFIEICCNEVVLTFNISIN